MGKFHVLFRGAWEMLLSIAGIWLLTRFPRQALSEWPWQLFLLWMLVVVAVVGSVILALSDFGLAWGLHKGRDEKP